MTTEPETTLAWAEVLWRVANEAPEMLLAWITVYVVWKNHFKPQPGKRIEIQLNDSVRIVEVGQATETDIALPVRAVKRVTLGIATETNAAMPVKVSGGTLS